MARSDDRGSDKGKVKVRVIEFEMEGSNQTLRDSIRDIVGAIGRAPQLRAPVAPKALGNNGAGAAAAEQTDTEEEFTDAEVVEVVDESSDDTTGGTPRKRSPPRSPVVLDLNLKQGAISLFDFMTKLNPTADNIRYACIAYWFKTYGGVTEVTADHIHTGYREMKWNTPSDASQPLRKLKTRQYGYMRSGSKQGTFVLIHIGDNAVRDLMKTAGLDA